MLQRPYISKQERTNTKKKMLTPFLTKVTIVAAVLISSGLLVGGLMSSPHSTPE
jgi:hypothetical protein